VVVGELMRTVPETSDTAPFRKPVTSSMSARMRRARSSKVWPSAVSVTKWVERLSSRTPSCSSFGRRTTR
jgi:hypothetical protein